jgi:hypothetical protein
MRFNTSKERRDELQRLIDQQEQALQTLYDIHRSLTIRAATHQRFQDAEMALSKAKAALVAIDPNEL